MQFRKSIGVVNSFLIYLLFLALTGIWISSEETGFSLYWLVIPNFILYTVVYGRMVDVIENSNKSPWLSLFAKHVLNYFVMTVILALPAYGLTFVYSDTSYVTKTISKNVIGALIDCLTIYALPLVFIEQRAITAIQQSLIFLFHNLRKSIFLLLLSFSIHVIRTLVALSIPFFIYRSDRFQISLGVGFLHNIILGYIDLIIFAMAAIFIIEKRKAINVQDASAIQM